MTLALAALTSCRYDVDEVLLQRSDISLTEKGKLQMSFDEKTCQLGYNQDRNEFRVYDDKIANWFTITCNAYPSSIGQEVTADLKYTTASDVKTETSLTFKVERVEPSKGMFWLWCNSKKIGVVVRKI